MKNSRSEAINEGGANETYYATIKMPCLVGPDLTEETKQAKSAAMKHGLDKHVAERQQRMTSSDFLGMNDKELLLNKHILTKMGIL